MEFNFDYSSVADIVKEAVRREILLSELILKQQAEQLECSCEVLFEKMKERYQVMKESVRLGSDPDLRSVSGLTGGDSYKVMQRHQSGHSLVGSLFSGAMYRALAVSELNAAMGKIVATPTAGSCGILPASVITMQEEYELSEEKCVMSLFTAAGVGMVIAGKAGVSGAQGGCQAECGSASAMAAAAIVELAGGTAEMAADAVAIVLKNVLGLVCDPVAGLVEIPCIKRNASGTATAFMAAELALSGVRSAIPADEVIVAMKNVGDQMSSSLKETAEGGLATTPTGKNLFQQVFGTEMKDDETVCSVCTGCGS
ncbi:L-serine ammonia-lyase, iron-sulfur-dependent, subunit alpha [Scatolibacter rhodanostii]|uniref:L-serine ammonia-lyase, iron-sulfur-dependent, subunit alpha n=1 Tax=Scatolibacter rhodanostii TaxID=2014781 RepID=UPI000C0794B3|nr:L-serine ammonia-lyase, iron-sulfur-dependent, subunit alpha [Scatolibacter rhodanostii]